MTSKNFILKEGAYLQTKGSKFVYDERDFMLKGYGLGNVFLFEPFMISLPGTDQNIKNTFKRKFGEEKSKQFFNALYENYISEADIEYIKSLGANFVRLPFSYTHFFDDTAPYQLKESGFAIFDRIINLCEKHNLLVIFDLHNSPGSQNRDVHGSCDNGRTMFWDFRALQDTVINLWTHIADRYKDNSVVAGYDVLNEPVYVPDAGVFSKFYTDLISSIRKVDKKHVIFLEGDKWAKDYSIFNLDELDCLDNLAWSYHLYPVNVLRDYKDAEWNSDHFRDEVTKILSTMPYDFPVWCGETGIHLPSDNAIADDELFELSQKQMLVDTLDILNELGHSWSVWTYKDCRSMGTVRPKPGNAWYENITKNVFDYCHNADHTQLIAELRDRVIDFFDLTNDGRNTAKTDPDDLSTQADYFVTCMIETIAAQLAEQKIWGKIFDGPDSTYSNDFDKMTADLAGAWNYNNCVKIDVLADIVSSHF